MPYSEEIYQQIKKVLREKGELPSIKIAEHVPTHIRPFVLIGLKHLIERGVVQSKNRRHKQFYARGITELIPHYSLIN